MRVNVMVGGPRELIPDEAVQHHQDEIWVGVDYGATRLLEWGITPVAAIGDFDSTNPAELARLRACLDDIEVYPPAKDFTDTQLGIMTAIKKYRPDKIVVWGATGGRLDQELANLYLPLQDAFSDYLARIELVDRSNVVRYFRPGNHSIYRRPGFDYLAFVNLTPVTGLTLPDEKYPLVNWHSKIPFSWSSNRFTSGVNHFSFDTGVVAVIWSRD